MRLSLYSTGSSKDGWIDTVSDTAGITISSMIIIGIGR